MKNKIINITLGILIVASVGVNVYQYNQNNSMRLEADSIQTEIDNANTNYISLSESISAKGEEITTLGNKIADLEDNLSNLQSTNSSLSTQIADLEKSVVSTDTTEVVTEGNGPTKDSVRANLDKQLADGVITKEVYDECIAMLGNMTFDGQGGYDIKPSSEPQFITPDTALELKEPTGGSGRDLNFDGPRDQDFVGVQVQ